METPKMSPKFGPELLDEESSVVLTDVLMTCASGRSLAYFSSLVATAAEEYPAISRMRVVLMDPLVNLRKLKLFLQAGSRSLIVCGKFWQMVVLK